MWSQCLMSSSLIAPPAGEHAPIQGLFVGTSYPYVNNFPFSHFFLPALKNLLEPAVVAQPLIPALRRQRQADLWVWGQPGLQIDFHTARATQRHPISKNQNPKQNKTKQPQQNHHQTNPPKNPKNKPWRKKLTNHNKTARQHNLTEVPDCSGLVLSPQGNVPARLIRKAPSPLSLSILIKNCGTAGTSCL